MLFGSILLLFVFLCILPMAVFDFISNILLGWVIYLGRVVPRTSINAAGVVSGIVCLALLILVGHAMARWLWRELQKDAPLPWRLRWTLSVIAVVVLMFVAGIGAVGVVHQSVWLAKSDRPLVQYTVGRANRVKCASNMRQIGQALLIYAQAHNNGLPDSLAPLLTTCDMTPEVFVCPSSNDENALGKTPEEQAAHLGEGTLSYVYYGHGLTLPLPPGLPLLSEPLSNHDEDGMNVFFADGTVTWMSPGEAEAALRVRSH